MACTLPRSRKAVGVPRGAPCTPVFFRLPCCLSWWFLGLPDLDSPLSLSSGRLCLLPSPPPHGCGPPSAVRGGEAHLCARPHRRAWGQGLL
eukprot:12890296-Prorocentrum_lima.AAC.1